jgi:hypothetical protein
MSIMVGTDRAALVRAFEAARETGDVAAMARTALALAADRQFGTPLGSTPAYLYQAYTRATGQARLRLAAELARTWVYGGEAARAVPFAREAVAGAAKVGDPVLLATALDAALGAAWGPDDLDERVGLAGRLEDAAAHVVDVETRLSASLWGLTIALETLDAIALQRQLRALWALAEESGSARVTMFAASRQGMYAALAGDVAAAGRCLTQTDRAGTEANEPDAAALVHELAAAIARQVGAPGPLAEQAEAFEEFGVRHGVRSILAESAQLWTAAGSPGTARRLLDQVAAGDLGRIPRDVDWVLTVALVTEVAARTGADELAAQGVELLTPYAGRGVVNAGGVSFFGVVEEYLAAGCQCLGRPEQAQAWRQRALAAYRRLGATWWADRLADQPPAAVTGTAAPTAHLRRESDGVWVVGRDAHVVAVREMKGFAYLRLLLQHPDNEIETLELSAAVAGNPGQLRQSGLGEVLDRQALAAYRKRLRDLDEDLAQAGDWSDQARVAALTGERSMLLDEIAAATGLGGRSRIPAAATERARVAVRKSIAAALRRIADVDPALGRHLRDTIRTGSRCGYHPDPTRPITWILDSP